MKKYLTFFNGIGEMIKILWQSSKVLTLLMIFNNLIRNALWPLRALVIKQIVDTIVLSLEDGFIAYRRSFWIYIVFFFLLFWSNRIWWPLNSYTQTLMLAKISHNTRLRIISVMEKIHLSFFDNSENYNTYTRALAQADDRRPINTVNTVLGFISLIISFVTAFTIMISINIPVTIILILSSIPSVVWEGRFNKKIYDFDQETTREKRFLGYLFSLFLNKGSAKEIRTFKTEEYLSKKYETALEEYNKKYFYLVDLKFKVDSFFWLILQCVLMAGYFLIISDAAADKIALGSLSYFLAVAGDLQGAIKNFGSSFQGIIQSNKYFDNLLQFEKQNTEEDNSNTYIPIPKMIESIEFRNVSFSYPEGEHEILKNVNFTLHYPLSVVLVGENGAGKTTLIKLLMGFYHPEQGEILLNNVNINRYDKKEYFKLFTVCFQDYMKYGFSLSDNITMGNEKVDAKRFDEIIKELELEGLISGLPDKEKTYLLREFDEKGVELSGGQYNKIAIARAMAKDAPIVLLDEPNAALDGKAEQNLFKIYEKLTKNKLGIMITHRFSTAVSADVILLLKDGQLIELGNHVELLKRDGEYASLFNMQAKHYVSGKEVPLQ